MKLNLNSPVVNILLIALVVVVFIQHRQFAEYRTNADAKMVSVSDEVVELRRQLQTAERKIDQLERSSIEGVVKQANGALIDGWQVLMNTVEQELRKMQESLQAPDELNGTQSNADASVSSQSTSTPAFTSMN